MNLAKIEQAIIDHPDNAAFTKKGWTPLFQGSKTARINIIGQAPGIRAQETGIPWDDASGKRLRQWLGLTDEQFYDSKIVALIPMDFYYPGKGKTGDLPPRKNFADTWHPPILELMPDIKLTVLVGQYAQKYYLGKRMKRNLTETVSTGTDYLPEFLPIVHPSPLNGRWLKRNQWFEATVVPRSQSLVQCIIGS